MRLKSPALRLFTQPFIQTQVKENIKAPRHWPLSSPVPGEFPAQMASNAENVSIWWRRHGSRKWKSLWMVGVSEFCSRKSFATVFCSFNWLWPQQYLNPHLCPGALKHWDRDKVASILQTTFSNAFSSINLFDFISKCHGSLSPRVHLTIFQVLSAKQMTNPHVNKWLSNLLTHIRVTQHQWINLTLAFSKWVIWLTWEYGSIRSNKITFKFNVVYVFTVYENVSIIRSSIPICFIHTFEIRTELNNLFDYVIPIDVNFTSHQLFEINFHNGLQYRQGMSFNSHHTDTISCKHLWDTHVWDAAHR